jgi:hypothetical protein
MPAGSGYYAASKAALEGMSGALYGELKPLGISVTVVEPGAFRTDFAGRSLTQSSTVIDDYAETAGKRRKEHDTAHGSQPGDPAKAAKAIIAAAESAEPPAVSAARQRCAQHLPPGSPQPDSTPSNLGAPHHKHRHRRLNCNDSFESGRDRLAIDEFRATAAVGGQRFIAMGSQAVVRMGTCSAGTIPTGGGCDV